MASTTAKPSIRLTAEWPGEKTVFSALTMLRMAGHWSPWLTGYAAYTPQNQKYFYWLLRMKFYESLHGLNANYANSQGL